VEYRPTCNCNAGDPVGCHVLDPFSGLGTTGQTACFLGHDYTGIELNPEYAKLAEDWIRQKPRWLLRKKKPKKQPKILANQLSLF
jgi:DNA modification methylase